MTNSFSTSPQMVRYDGKVEGAGKLFIVKQSSPPPANARKITIRVESANRWSAEVKERRNGTDSVVETFTFSRTSPTAFLEN